MNISANPSLPVEYIGLVLESLSVLAVLTILGHRVVQLIRKKGETRLQSLVCGVAFMILVSQGPIMLKFFHQTTPSINAPILTWVVITTPIAGLLYLLFQIYVFERFRLYTSWPSITTNGLACTTIICFFGLQSPSLAGYYSGVSEPNAILEPWSHYEFFWYLYVGFLDVVLNLTLLKIFWSSKAFKSNEADGLKFKRILVALCVCVLCYDLFGVICLELSNNLEIDEYVWRSNRAFAMMANSAVGFHGAMGLNYLSVLVTAQSRIKSSRIIKASKAMSKSPSKNMNESMKNEHASNADSEILSMDP